LGACAFRVIRPGYHSRIRKKENIVIQFIPNIDIKHKSLVCLTGFIMFSITLAASNAGKRYPSGKVIITGLLRFTRKDE
jgi:hypothetical protein